MKLAYIGLVTVFLGACCPANVRTAPEGPPDADRDGVADADDQCPQDAGVIEFGGCADSDGDGFPDNTDECRNEAGVQEHRGCPPPPPPPDQDGDGFTDATDACPAEAGKQRTNGCPDADNDGVADKDDKCPSQAGVPAEQGCLPEAVQKFAGAIKGITFNAGSATIRKASNKTLDEAVAVLNQYPDLRLEVQGHTDDQGPDDANMKLSQDRADAVKAYFVSKGIAENRVTAKGYGETRPVADNKKAAGRTQNRRIEFQILGSE